MAKFGPLTGAAWIDARLHGSQVARRGGPVRLSENSIMKQVGLERMFAAIMRKSWCVDVIGGTWLIYDPLLRKGRLIGFHSGLPLYRL